MNQLLVEGDNGLPVEPSDDSNSITTTVSDNEIIEPVDHQFQNDNNSLVIPEVASSSVVEISNVNDVLKENTVTSVSVSTEVTPVIDSVVPPVPRIHDVIQCIDPDTNNVETFHVFSRGGKQTGGNKTYFNVRNLETGQKKGIDLAKTKWSHIEHETLYNVNSSEEVQKAQQEELRKWKEYSVYVEVDDDEQTAINLRWVITQKTVDDGSKLVKARLVARGFEEDTSSIRTDSPTVSKENIRLISTIAVANGWNVHSIDVRSAFLQGFQIDREVYVVPPPEAGVHKKLWKLNKTIYGLCDASRAWYLRSSEEIIEKGAIRSKYDNAVFYKRDGSNLLGIVCSHVDDFFYNGSQSFHDSVINHLRSTFSLSQECFDQMIYIGIELKQTENNIIMHQKSYIAGLESVPISGSSSKRPLEYFEIRQLKGLVGQLQWVAKLSRPDIAFDVCELSTRVKEATTADLKRANKIVLKIQSEPSTVQIPFIGDIHKSQLFVYSDASFGNLPGGASQGGFIIFLVGENGNASPIVWTSHKLKRVVRSAKAAETLAMQSAAEYAFLLKSLLLEIHGLEKHHIPVICIIDNESLHSSVHTTNTIDDRRLYIDICSLRDMLTNKEISEVILTTTDEQLAGCLTKSTASSELLRNVLNGMQKLPELRR